MPKSYEKELMVIIAAWQSLPKGAHNPSTVEQWLRTKMSPAINNARTALGMSNASP